MTYPCIGAWHKGDGTASTHRGAVLVWPKEIESALRNASTAEVESINSMMLCAQCQRMLTDPKPDPKATELQRQMKSMKPTGKNPALDYDHTQWCFLSPAPDTISDERE
jgi:hypothetical protein